jgi:spore germination protein YaaH
MKTSYTFAILLAVASALPASAGPAAPRKTVYAWFPHDMDAKRNNDWSTAALDWGAITHLCFRAVILKPDGGVEPGFGTTPERVRKLVQEARSHGVKITVLTWGTNSQGSSSYLANHAAKTVDNLLAYVKTYELDGVNIDDESWRKDNAVTGGPNRELVTAFFKLLHDKFKAARADYHLSWASPGVIAPDDRFADSWPDYKAVSEYLDTYTVMSYVMCPPGIGWTGAAQPLGGGGKVGPHARDYRTLVQDYLAATGGRKEKLVMGLGLDRGGFEWDCKTDQPLSWINGKARPLAAADARANAEKHGRKFDANQKAPWYCYAKGDGFVQGWYEDDESFAAKLAFFREQDVAGVCLWAVDGVREPAETFKLLRRHILE